MSTWKLVRRSVGLCAALVAALAIGPAGASAADTCTAPAVSQPFLAYGDSAWYSIVPGQSHDNFDGTGWALSGGATLSAATLANGQAGQVLNLPVNGKAVSPPMCVNNLYPYLRTMVSSASKGYAKINISYLRSTGWTAPKATGQLQSSTANWALSSKIKLVNGPDAGWQMAQFTLVGGGRGAASTRIYNLYADPKMRR